MRRRLALVTLTSPSGGRDRVNARVEEQTDGQIIDLLPTSSVTSYATPRARGRYSEP